MIRRCILILLLLVMPVALLAQHEAGVAHERLYFGFIPAWVLKLVNMVLFIGALVWLLKGPIGGALRGRADALRREAEEARERRIKADQMASDIQTRLAQIEKDVQSIHQRAQAEGERQKRELIAAAEAEATKILQAARNEVDNRLKSAKIELTEYAGQLATERAEAILREQITDEDRRKLFQESLRDVSEER